MSLVRPEFLLALLLLPIFYAINRWRFRRKRLPVSSLLFWRNLPAESPSPRREWKRRLNLLLLLQALCFSAFVLALCGPVLILKRGGSVLLVIDRSASMNARAKEGKTRLQWGLEAASRLVAGLPPDTRIELTALPLDSKSVQGGKDQVCRALSGLEGTDAPLGLEDALRSVLALHPENRNVPCYVVTDRFTSLRERRGGRIHVASFGFPARNLGITHAGAGKEGMVVEIGNFSARGENVPLRVWVDGEESPFSKDPLSLAPGEKRKVVLPIPLGDAEEIQVALGIQDDLDADNQCRLLRIPLSTVRVYSEGIQNPFFLKALEAVGGVEVVEGASQNHSPPENFALYFFNRKIPEPLPGGEVTAFYPVEGIGTIRVKGEERIDGPIRVNSPLLEGEGFEVRIGSLLQFDPVIWDEVYLRGGGEKERVLAGRKGRTTVFAFRLEESDIHFHPIFPILFAQILERVRGKGAGEFASFRTGESVKIPWLRGKEVEVKDPPGRVQVHSLKGDPFAFFPLHRGIYRLRSEGQELSVSVNLHDEEESDIRGERQDWDLGEIAGGGQREEKSLLFLCILLGFFLLGLLWWFEKRI